MNTLYIVIPAYNEAENITACVEDWYAIVERYGGEGSRLVVIDDGSRDDTWKEILRCAETAATAPRCSMAIAMPLIMART